MKLATCTQYYCTCVFLDWNESFSLWSYESTNVGTDITWTVRTKEFVTQRHSKGKNSSRTALFVMKPWQHIPNTIAHLSLFLDWNESSSVWSYESTNVGTMIPELHALKNHDPGDSGT